MNLSIQGLHFGYRNRPILRDVHIEAASGSFCALLGANGAGKSTLLKCIAGVLRPKVGSIRAGDMELTALSPRQRARLTGYVPQNAQPGDGGLNVLETVLSGRVPAMRGRLREEDYQAAEEILLSMDLAPYALRPLGRLSGGERQRVLIARAVAQRPSILLLDEPTNNLDLRYQQETMERIKDLSAREQITVVTILHDLNLTILYADQAVLLQNGQIYAAGEPQAVLNGESIRAIFGVETNFATLGEKRYIVPRRRAEAEPPHTVA